MQREKLLALKAIKHEHFDITAEYFGPCSQFGKRKNLVQKYYNIFYNKIHWPASLCTARVSVCVRTGLRRRFKTRRLNEGRFNEKVE